jgi:DAK2 domain fusion protein YloV
MSNELPLHPALDGQTILEMEQLNGQALKTLVGAGLAWLKVNQQYVNSLNVFPVPDGDTGTNMLLTMQAAQNEIMNSNEENVGKVAHAIAQGALMGARGNSGVILSQLLRGFARSLDNFDKMDAQMMVDAFNEARITAYKGVVRPVEGTILTVAKDIAIEASQAITDTTDMLVILERLIKAADESVKRTPDLLPILKQANVVDAGGKGLYFLLEGVLRYIKGLSLESSPTTMIQPISAMMQTDQIMETIEPGQDYEIIIDFQPEANLDLENFYDDLSEIGTSIQMGEGDGMYRMHIHVPTDKRYAPIDYIMKKGTVLKVHIENLLAQMGETKIGAKTGYTLAAVQPGEIAVVTISPGDGLSKIFASLGVASVVDGGQTMNPATVEILQAFENLPTDKIIILPNNKNIIMAAQTAASTTVKKVAVIPSLSIPQGLSALLHHNPDGDFDSVVSSMVNALKDVETGEITCATRKAVINNITVDEGSYISLLDGTLVVAADNLKDACIGLLEKAGTDERERITLFSGNNISKDEVENVAEIIRAKYPSHEIEIHEGGQPHYQFIIAIE